ncbi:glycerophosphodiester phosphodiesterase [Homoserinibacter gongjuensis]|uniref:GP-PDE domain-containing protein n=1 Tax=Homoserinibacter gongjuensis TaxID=1162968 RepID=A0ABQ6JNP0_9MICO|nr:glycerophosphodiester phosphodiesterase family protein [Homoserinibacter gongjuensis]GMA89878.1 hypothetical protein GCM10025869_04070 [Homoserinibacter gongjuensis]
MTARRFIAHRGVHLGFTIAGENSLEAVALARRAGFACIETDVRLSSDGELVVMHDETLNRTAALADGTRSRPRCGSTRCPSVGCAASTG